jgi:hypothetical protein
VLNQAQNLRSWFVKSQILDPKSYLPTYLHNLCFFFFSFSLFFFCHQPQLEKSIAYRGKRNTSLCKWVAIFALGVNQHPHCYHGKNDLVHTSVGGGCGGSSGRHCIVTYGWWWYLTCVVVNRITYFRLEVVGANSSLRRNFVIYFP